MCPESAAEKIPNLLISVNDCGVTDHKTLHSAYQELDKIIQVKGIVRPVVVIADGHKSRFGDDVMSFCNKSNMDQYLLPPDTSGVTQLHDQVNDRLHKKYEETKDSLFSEYSDINKEGFMMILGEIWAQ